MQEASAYGVGATGHRASHGAGRAALLTCSVRRGRVFPEAGMDEIRVLSPTAILGYGYPRRSLEEGMRRDPHVIAVDAGSTDGGPYYLGIDVGHRADAGQASAFMETLSRDVGPLLEASLGAGVPLLVGSAGFAGGEPHLMGTVAVFRKVAEERGLRFEAAVIHAEVDKEYIKEKLRAGKIEPLGPVPELTEQEVDAAVRIVGQMGVEPFQRALERGVQVVIAGRANDPSMFAALPLMHGFDRGLGLHMAKILECGAIAAQPGSGSDAMLGTLRRDHFVVEPLAPGRRCTTMSVGAHSLYEKSDPYTLFGPGGQVDLSEVRFEQESERSVKVSGSRFVPADAYRIKLEGAKRVGYRCVAVCGVRDPVAIQKIDELIDAARAGAARQFSELDPSEYELLFHVYGRDGVMGSLEPARDVRSHELGIVIEAVAPTQPLATSLCSAARIVMLHHGFTGRISTAGNLAFPFSPLDIAAGPVCEFNVYHLVEEDDPHRLFPQEMVDF
jgi:hypothetical protein